MIDQGQHEPVCQARAEFLHQIQCQGGAPRAVPVQEPYIGIQPHAFQGGSAVVGQDAVEEREDRVYRVHGWAPAAGLEGKQRLFPQDHLVEHAEINRGPGAFQASEAV